MSSNRILRGAALIGTAGLILGAFVAVPALAKKPAACKVFKAKTDGKGQPVSVVTDAATADKPVTVTVATTAGAGLSSPDGPSGDTPAGGPTHTYYNVQVDSKAKSARLYVRAEFAPVLDYDLYLRDEGAALAYSAGAPAPIPAQGLDGTGNGGHSEVGAENIDGWTAADCAGYTVDIVSATTPGVDVTLKFWLAK
jgi:hypothetical protein